MPTAHIEARENEIAKTVLMPGDPKRAKYIAENFLENIKLVNQVRGIFAYTGTYKGKELTIMASGMGMPSIGIYSYELYKFYDVENIIRIGSSGAYTKDLNLYDILLVEESYTESTYAKVQNNETSNTLHSNKELNDIIISTAKELNKKITLGKIHSSDVFYSENKNIDNYTNNGCLAVEMESFALFHNANTLNKKAACILTISDNLITKEETTSDERETSFNDMIELALNSAVKL